MTANKAWAKALINAHATGVWEHMDSFDAKQNRLAIEHEQHKDELPEGEYDPQRIFSHYTICGKKIYVITEWDRSLTTLLFPHEYYFFIKNLSLDGFFLFYGYVSNEWSFCSVGYNLLKCVF